MASRAVVWVEGVVLFLALYLGVPWLGLTLDRALGWPAFPAWTAWIGLPLLGLGAAGVAWSFSLFVKVGHGTPNPIAPPRELVTAGPFAWVRNPIILSHAFASLGLALLVGSPAAAIIVFLIGIPVQFNVRHEEGVLERRYGDAYRAYKSEVPRWIPRRPRHSR